jgi:hypothetical protein
MTAVRAIVAPKKFTPRQTAEIVALGGRDLLSKTPEFKFVVGKRRDVPTLYAADCPHFMVQFESLPNMAELEAALAEVCPCPLGSIVYCVSPASDAPSVFGLGTAMADALERYLAERPDDVECECVADAAVSMAAPFAPGSQPLVVNLEHDPWCSRVARVGLN